MRFLSLVLLTGWASLVPAQAEMQRPLPGETPGVAVSASGGNRVRSAADRAADTLNPLDFAGPVDPATLVSGATDAAPAFRAAIASRPAGAALRLVVPFGRYRLDGDVTDQGRTVTIDLRSGARAGANYGGTGTGVLYVQRVESKAGEANRTDIQGIGSPRTVAAIGQQTTVINGGAGNAAFGETYNYINRGTSVSNNNGGDIGRYQNAHWPSMSGAGLMGEWEVAVSPTFTAAEVAGGKNFSMSVREVNPVNNSPDTGFSEFDSRATDPGIGVPPTFTGGYLIVPDIWRPSGGVGGHLNYGLALLGSRETNKRTPAYSPKIYAPLLIGSDSIAPDGRGIFVGGATGASPAELPRTPLAAKYAFARGIDLTEAAFANGQAVSLPAGASLAWGAGPGAAGIVADRAGRVTITAPGGLALPEEAWTPFSPAVAASAGTIRSYTAAGQYRKAGGRIEFSLSIAITDGGNGRGGVRVLGLPAPAGPVAAAVAGKEAGTTQRALAAVVPENASEMLVHFYDGTYPASTGSRLVLSGSYPTR